MKKPALIAACLALAACDIDDGRNKPTRIDAAGSRSTFIGEVDGCRLWWVRNAYGSDFSFAKCSSPSSVNTGWRVQGGKTTYRRTALSVTEGDE